MHTTRIASLDLLRGLAAFSVAIPHYLILALGTSPFAERVSVLAVEIFFVLSGFVLAPQILGCINDRRLANLGIFLVRRWMRTIPPYLFALVLISLVADELLTADFFRYAFYVQNLIAQSNANDYFPVAWSLSIEEWFYVTMPVWLLLATGWLRRWDKRCIVVLALVYIAAVAVARTACGDYDNWGPEVRRVVLFRVDSIAYGFLLYLFVREVGPRVGAGRLDYVKALLAALLFLAVALVTFVITSSVAEPGHLLLAHLFPFCAAAFGATALVLFYTMRKPMQKLPLIATCCDHMGKISYSVYLFHLVIALAVRSSFSDLAVPAQLAIFLAACVAGSSLFFYCFERPILAARPRYRLRDVSDRMTGTDPLDTTRAQGKSRDPSHSPAEIAVDRA